jgi:hypothetical protein
MTKVRFQADADLKQAILTGTIRREPNIDFQSAYAAGLEGKLDPETGYSHARWKSFSDA